MTPPTVAAAYLCPGWRGLGSAPSRTRLLRFQTRSQGRPLLRVACQRVSHALCQREHDTDRWTTATALRLDVPSVSNDLIFETTPGLGLEAVRTLEIPHFDPIDDEYVDGEVIH